MGDYNYNSIAESRGRKLPKVISIEEFNELLKYTKKKHHKLAFKLGFLCCLRVSEVVKLKKEDIDMNRGFLFIRQAKGNKDRYVPIPDPIKRSIKQLPIKCGIRALQIAINNKSEKAINKRIHFHTLRHSGATWYLSRGMDIRQVQMFLGHAKLETTAIYLHTNPIQLKKTVDGIWSK